MSEDTRVLKFPSVDYLTLLDMKAVKESLGPSSKDEPMHGFQEKWTSEVTAYYRDLGKRHEMRLEGSSMKTVNDLFQRLRELMKKEHKISPPFKEAIISICPGENDTTDKIDYLGEFGNVLEGSQADPNPNLATEKIILEIAENHGVDILTGEPTTKYTRIPDRFAPFPHQEDVKYLVMCPVCVSGTVNRVLDTAVDLRDKNKKRIFENLSVYDSEGRLIKGIDRGIYEKISTKQKEKALRFVV